MFDLGWTEMMIIAMVALVIIGPKDLPNALKSVAYWVRKGRGAVREFQRGIDDMVREAELGDVRRDLEAATRPDFSNRIEKTLDPGGEVAATFKGEQPAKSDAPAAAPSTHKNSGAQSEPPTAAPAEDTESDDKTQAPA